MSLAAKLSERIVQIEGAPATIAAAAAPRIQAKLRADATTKRGNVPGFGEMGGPITATSGSDSITVTAPDWVHEKASELKQPDGWVAIVADEARRVVGGG